MTEDEDKESTYTKAIDNWIKVINSHGTEVEKKKDLTKKEVRKIRKTEKTRDNLMHRMGKKQNYFSFSSLSSSDENNNTKEASFNSPAMKSPAVKSSAVESPSCSQFITPAVSTASNSDRRPLKHVRQSRPFNDDASSLQGIGLAVTKYVEVLAAQQAMEVAREAVRESARESVREEEEATRMLKPEVTR